MPLFNERNGFKGNIYSVKENLPIASALLVDCQKIHDSNVTYLRSKGQRKKPLYDKVDMYNCISKFQPMEVGKRVELDSNLHVELRYNSHTVGSCNATIYIKKPSNKRWYSIIYTSDMGSQINRGFSNYLKDQDLPLKADIVISEATYSSPDREIDVKLTKKERKEFLDIIKNGLQNGKRILLPTFAFSRSQQIVTNLFLAFSKEKWFIDGGYEIIMDGYLMNAINDAYLRVLEGEDRDLFKSVMNWSRLRRIKEYTGTTEFLKVRKPSVILCGSGFLENGRVSTYLPIILGCSDDIIMLTGYCSQDNEGSLGWKLLNDTQKQIEFTCDGVKRNIYKSAAIYQQKTWTSHISYSELKEYFAKVDCSKIIVHHINEKNKGQFIAECNEYIRSKNKTTKVITTSDCCNQFVL